VLAGKDVHIWMYSTPKDLGIHRVASDGSVRVQIPTEVPAGNHRVVLYGTDGAFLGWTPLTVIQVQGNASLLPWTGTDKSTGILVGSGTFVLFLGLILVWKRRRSAKHI
jgi:LPXTG-motif cell wall-anchored protein